MRALAIPITGQRHCAHRACRRPLERKMVGIKKQWLESPQRLAARKYCGSSCFRAANPKKKYFPTEWIDALIREDYLNRYQLGRGFTFRLAEKVGWPKYAITRRAGELGLRRSKEPPWGKKEIAILERHGHRGIELIRRRLARASFRRTRTSILLKRKRLRIPANLEGYSANALASFLGVDQHVIARWIHRGYLRATRRGTERTPQQGGDYYYILPGDVRRLVLAHPGEIHLGAVDKFWFLDLIANG